MLFSARIKELEGQLSTLQANHDTLAAANAELTTANGQCATQHAADQETIGAMTGELTQVRAELASVSAELETARTALTQAEAGRESAIATQVTQRISAAGADPIKRDPAVAVETNGGATSLSGMAKARAYLADRQPKPVTGSN